jgi:hypothetical protein
MGDSEISSTQYNSASTYLTISDCSLNNIYDISLVIYALKHMSVVELKSHGLSMVIFGKAFTYS